jgi:DNA-binding GntR family transcriptional regulator
MKTYLVTLGIVGRAIVEVEAESEGAAIERACEEITRDDIDEWEALTRACRGNVCSRPSPWDATAKEIDDD